MFTVITQPVNGTINFSKINKSTITVREINDIYVRRMNENLHLIRFAVSSKGGDIVDINPFDNLYFDDKMNITAFMDLIGNKHLVENSI